MRALLSTGQRDRSRTLLTVLSAALAAATVAGTGVATAAAAQETARSNAEKAQKQAAAEAAAAKAHHKALLKWAKENPVVVTKARPEKTVIGPPTLVKASGSGSARVGGGSSRRRAVVDHHPQPPGPAAPARPEEHRLVTTLVHEPATAARVDTEHGAASWRALGTYVELRTTPDAVEAAAGLAARVLDEVDVACSRFRDDSDLVRANRAAGTPVEVSPVLVGAVRLALEAAAETDGLVDPLLGDLLVAAGYDRTFVLVPSDDPTPAALPVCRGRWQDVVVTDTTVCVPPGAALDLGATGKAFAADLVALSIADTLGVPVLAGVGGDLRVASPDDSVLDHPVEVGHSVADLDAGGASAVVRLGSGGLATSSVSARRWRRGGRQWHHVVDPRTGLPAQGPWRTVTALGRTAAAANAATTASIVLGAAAHDWLVDHHVAARLVDHDGRVVRTPAWTTSGLEETA